MPQIVKVKVIELGGYLPGVTTTMEYNDHCRLMIKNKKVILLGGLPTQNKLAPDVDEKGNKGGDKKGNKGGDEKDKKGGKE